VAAKAVLDDEDCDGEDMKILEECLMRRTLAAHVDYIYTQKHSETVEEGIFSGRYSCVLIQYVYVYNIVNLNID
jgi:hypothetical protein